MSTKCPCSGGLIPTPLLSKPCAGSTEQSCELTKQGDKGQRARGLQQAPAQLSAAPGESFGSIHSSTHTPNHCLSQLIYLNDTTGSIITLAIRCVSWFLLAVAFTPCSIHCMLRPAPNKPLRASKEVSFHWCNALAASYENSKENETH